MANLWAFFELSGVGCIVIFLVVQTRLNFHVFFKLPFTELIIELGIDVEEGIVVKI